MWLQVKVTRSEAGKARIQQQLLINSFRFFSKEVNKYNMDDLSLLFLFSLTVTFTSFFIPKMLLCYSVFLPDFISQSSSALFLNGDIWKWHFWSLRECVLSCYQFKNSNMTKAWRYAIHIWRTHLDAVQRAHITIVKKNLLHMWHGGIGPDWDSEGVTLRSTGRSLNLC